MSECNHFWRAVDSTRSQCAKCGEITSPEREARRHKCKKCGGQIERLTAENAELQAQIDALQQRVHLCAGYDRLENEHKMMLAALTDYAAGYPLTDKAERVISHVRGQALQDLADNDQDLIDWGETEKD